jgi:uncharacterized protein YacL
MMDVITGPIIISAIGVTATIISTFFAWRHYVNNKKSKEDELMRLYEDKAEKEYREKGSPKKYLDTLDISDSKKADIYDNVIKRKKGRVGKSNPYR